jgi:hypothetical protein
MSASGVGRWALLAYPPGVRRERGEEMLGTLLDAADDSRLALVRGAGSLLIGGGLERARENARVGTRRLVADAFCLAAVLWSLIELQRMTAPYFEAPLWTMVVLAGVPVLAALGRDRLAGLCGIAVVAHALIVAYGVPASVGGPGPVLIGHPGLVFFLGQWLGAAVCFLVMVLRPRRRTVSPRQLLGLALFGALLAAHASSAATAIGILIVLAVVGIQIGLPVIGILALPIDPRLAIASAVLWADVAAASTLGHTRLGLLTVPLVLLATLITAARNKTLARRAAG